MDFHQLRIFAVVAETGSITRASDKLNLSQPAISAHIKALEETLALPLFERTARGMELTNEGRSVLASSQVALEAHAAVLTEATRMRGTVVGPLRLAAAANAPGDTVGHLMIAMSEQYPQVEVHLTHATSSDVLERVRSGELDAGFCVEDSDLKEDVTTIETARFGTYLTAPTGMIDTDQALDWQSMAERVWIAPSMDSCCGRAMENLFRMHNLRPRQIIRIDRESVTRTLVAGGVGIGILHADTARLATEAGEVDILTEVEKTVRVLFVYSSRRVNDPIIRAVTAILRKA